MEMIIGYTLLLALFQIWLIPMMLNSKNLNWQLSNRDNEPEHPPSLMLSRATKAKDNLKETLPIFLALAVWSITAGIDISGFSNVVVNLKSCSRSFIYGWHRYCKNFSLASINNYSYYDGISINLKNVLKKTYQD